MELTPVEMLVCALSRSGISFCADSNTIRVDCVSTATERVTLKFDVHPTDGKLGEYVNVEREEIIPWEPEEEKK